MRHSSGCSPSLALAAAASTDAVDGSTLSFLLQRSLQYQLEVEKRKKEKEEKAKKAKEEDDNAFIQSMLRKHGINPRGSPRQKRRRKRRKKKLPKLHASSHSSSTGGSLHGGGLFTKECDGESTAASVCWMTRGAMTPVHGPRQCDFFSFFSTTGTLLSAWALNTSVSCVLQRTTVRCLSPPAPLVTHEHMENLRLHDAGRSIPEKVRLLQDSLHNSFQFMLRGLTAHAPWYP